MTGLMSLCGAATVATAGDNDGQRRAAEGPGEVAGPGPARPGADLAPGSPSEGREGSLGSLTPGLNSGLET